MGARRAATSYLGGFAAKLGGNDQGGFFEPEFSRGFDFGADGPPNLSIGVWIERFSAGAKGAGYSVQMSVWDKGSERRVNLYAPHGLTAVYKPKKLVNTADSTGERNELGELLRWCHELKCLARPAVQAPLDALQVLS